MIQKYTKNQIDEILTEYLNTTLTQNEVAKKYALTQTAITYHLKKRNLRSKPSLTQDPKIIESILYMYSFYMGQQDIAKELNINSHTVGKILRQQDIDIRPKGGYKGYRKNFLNENYFESIDSHDKSYILGLLYTDGNVINNGMQHTLQLGLKAVDVKLIEMVKNKLEYTGPIETWIDYRKEPPSIKKSIRPNSVKLVNDLAKHGMVPNKTLTIQWPTTIPYEFMNSFILGCLDGDGCWSQTYDNRSGKHLIIPIFSVVSASESFLYEMSKYLHNTLDIGFNKINKSIKYKNGQLRKNPIYRLTYSYMNKCQLLYDFLYKDATIWLDRKHNKIESILRTRSLKDLV